MRERNSYKGADYANCASGRSKSVNVVW